MKEVTEIKVNNLYINKYGCIILATHVNESGTFNGVIVRQPDGYPQAIGYSEDFLPNGLEIFTGNVTIQNNS